MRRRSRLRGPPPEQCKGMPADKWIDIQDNKFRFHEYGKCSTIVDDQNASDGKAARMPGDHYEWAISYLLLDDSKKSGPWRCYVAARCDATAADGPGMTMGIYDLKLKKNATKRTISVRELSGAKYRVFDLGVHKLNAGMNFWCAPPKRPGKVQAVYIDRIYLIREKQ